MPGGATACTITDATSAASTFVAATETSADPGKYASPAIPAGNYKMTVEKDGYCPPGSKQSIQDGESL